ncbi:MAG: TonB-dependent receptor [Verrucomicrobiales bacterium]
MRVYPVCISLITACILALLPGWYLVHAQEEGPNDGLLGTEEPAPFTPDQPSATSNTTESALFPDPSGSSVDDGKFVGFIFDAESGSPLSSASVLVGSIETLTNDRGRFVFDNIPPGNQTVIIVRDGYFPATLQTQIFNDRPTVLRAGLKEKPIGDDVVQLEAVTVIEELADEEKSGIEFQQLAIGQKDLFSSAQFSKAGASDVAQGVAKVAGVNVVGGRYAVIRGLGDRYSNTTVNGAIVSSADPSKKAVQLDLFPADLVGNLVVSKTFSPDLSADFAGGSIDIQTLRFPSERFLKFGLGLSFNNATKQGTLLLNSDRRLDWLGRSGDKFPEVSQTGLFPSGAVLDPALVPDSNPQKQFVVDQQKAALSEWPTLHSSGSFKPTAVSIDPNFSFDLAFGDTFDTDMGEIGIVLALTQGRKFDYTEKQIARGSRNSGTFSLRQAQDRTHYSEQVGFGTLASLGIRPNENHELAFMHMWNRSAEDEIVEVRRAINDEKGTTKAGLDEKPGIPTLFQGDLGRVFQAADQIGLTDRSLKIYQLDGSHKLTGNDVKFDWVASFSESNEDRPDQRTLLGNQIDFADKTLSGLASLPDSPFNPSQLNPDRGSLLTFSDITGNNVSNSFREWLNTFETGKNIKADLSWPIYFDNKKENRFELKMGVGRFDRERQVRGRLFSYQQESNFPQFIKSVPNWEQNGIDVWNEFDDVFVERLDGISRTGRGGQGLAINEQTTSGATIRNVDARSTIESRYLMGTLEYENVTLVGGMRYEEEERDYFILPGLNPSELIDVLQSPGPQVTEYWLPAASATLKFGPDNSHKVSIAYGQTVARPTFYEFAPIRTSDQSTGLQTRGNPDLEDTIIDNLDFRWQWFPNDTDLFGVSLFHKSMENPIVPTVAPLNNSAFFQSWDNSSQGTIQGIEIELQKQLTDTWSINSNLTYLDSFIEPLLDENGVPVGNASVFEGQPEWIFNMNLGYSHEEWGLDANLVYNYTSQILTNVSSDPLVPNIFQEGIHSLDLILSKEFGSGIKLKFAAKNLFDWQQRRFYEGEDVSYENYSKGRTYSVSLGFDF